MSRNRARDFEEIRTPLDILHRTARPQRNSSHIPRTRDWRYETGVYQHQDFKGSPNDQSIWDQLDEDYTNGIFGRERRKIKGAVGTQDRRRSGMMKQLSEEKTTTKSRSRTGSMEMQAPKKRATIFPMTPETTPRKGRQTAPFGSWRNIKGSPAHSTSTFELSEELTEDYKEIWKKIGLVVKLLFPSRRTAFQQILEELPTPLSPHLSSAQDLQPVSPPTTPCTPLTSSSVTSRGTVETFSVSERQFQDFTRNYGVRKLWSSLRPASKSVEQIPESYTWFPLAVPIDAIFPPGIPLSAKEINAYYPHHIRWKGVALRMLNNGYRSQDILDIQSFFRGASERPISSAKLSDHIRGLFRSVPDFSITGFKGKPDDDMYTDDLATSQFISKRGVSVPTLDDLLSGLKFLPSGLDARELTQCLVWYLNNRDAFTPRLELNILHTQSLVRALQLPLKSCLNRNLNVIGLQEWKDEGKFVERRVDDEMKIHSMNRASDNEETTYSTDREKHETRKGSRLELNTQDETVKPTIDIKLRHVLMLPFLKMQSLVGEALEMGIENAENKEAKRKQKEEPQDRVDGTSSYREVQNPVKNLARVGNETVEIGKKRYREYESDFSGHPAKRRAVQLDHTPQPWCRAQLVSHGDVNTPSKVHLDGN